MDGWHMPLAVLVVIGAPALGIYLAIKAYGGKHGERYNKWQTQGPFAPLSKEELVEEDDRIRRRRAQQDHA